MKYFKNASEPNFYDNLFLFRENKQFDFDNLLKF